MATRGRFGGDVHHAGLTRVIQVRECRVTVCGESGEGWAVCGESGEGWTVCGESGEGWTEGEGIVTTHVP